MITDLLPKLDKVRQTGVNKWIARCPAHDDKSPSLAITEQGDGRILIYCFAGCTLSSPELVLNAIGLDITALFPEQSKGGRYLPTERRSFSPTDVLRCLSLEATFLLVVSSDLRQGIPLSDSDHSRLLIAAQRIDRAVEVANG